MSDTEASVEKYVAAWANPDSAARRRVIADLWAEDGAYSSASTIYSGRDGIEEAVTNTYEGFVPRGFSFRVARIDTNHETVRYQWEVIPPGGGEPTLVGTQFVVVGADGRWVSDHQFIDRRTA
jgi:hypothetical protein